jgi:hypothetical protein
MFDPRQNYDPDDLPDAYRDLPGFLTYKIVGPGDKLIASGVLTFRQYQTGSYGWHTAGKVSCPGDPNRKVQVNLGLTIIGSKPGSRDAPG